MESLTSQLNNQLAGSSNLQTSLDSFYGAVQDMANAPSDAASRQVLLARAGGLASTFRARSGQFNQLSGQVQQQNGVTVDSLNSERQSLGKLYRLIGSSQATAGPPHHHLPATHHD